MLIGLIVGVVIGLLIGPTLRSWLVWREHLEADREARLHEELIRQMSPGRHGEPSDERDPGPIGTR